MARFTHIQCGCGAKINTDIAQLIDRFDELHGNAKHQELMMEMKMSRTRIRPSRIAQVEEE